MIYASASRYKVIQLCGGNTHETALNNNCWQREPPA